MRYALRRIELQKPEFSSFRLNIILICFNIYRVHTVSYAYLIVQISYASIPKRFSCFQGILNTILCLLLAAKAKKHLSLKVKYI